MPCKYKPELVNKIGEKILLNLSGQYGEDVAREIAVEILDIISPYAGGIFIFEPSGSAPKAKLTPKQAIRIIEDGD